MLKGLNAIYFFRETKRQLLIVSKFTLNLQSQISEVKGVDFSNMTKNCFLKHCKFPRKFKNFCSGMCTPAYIVYPWSLGWNPTAATKILNWWGINEMKCWQNNTRPQVKPSLKIERASAMDAWFLYPTQIHENYQRAGH